MSEPITLNSNKYTFHSPQDQHSVFCKRYGEEWRDFVGDSAIFYLFHYSLDLQNELKNTLCDCGNISPSKSVNDPGLHLSTCKFRQVTERIKDE